MNIAIIDVVDVEDLKTIEDKLAHMIVALFSMQQILGNRHPAQMESRGLEVLLEALISQLDSQNAVRADRVFFLANSIASQIKANLQDMHSFLQQTQDERYKAGQN